MTAAATIAAAADRRRAANLRAAGLTALAVVLFGLSDAVAKSLAAAHPPGQIIACRGLATALLLALVVAARGGGPAGRGTAALASGVAAALRDRSCWARALFETGAAYCFITALARLPIADATALLFVFPLLLTVLAALVLRERVGARRWAAVAAGLAGVLVILRPGAVAFDPASLWPLAAAACVAGRDLSTRFVSPAVPSGAVALVTTCLTALAGLASLAVGAGWTPVGAASLAGFAAGAALVGAAFLALVEGTRAGDVSFTAPFRYVAVPFSFLLGWLAWGQAPDALVVLGGAIVAGSGLLTLGGRTGGGGGAERA
jgi:drug/metabolite transporter (DMT)-like permease